MIDKLKSLGSSLKDLFLFLVIPLMFVAGFIWKLLAQNKELKDEVAQSQTETRIAQLKEQAGVADEEEKSAEMDYDTARKQYLSEHPDDKS